MANIDPARSYRAHFQDDDSAERYDREQIGSGTHGHLLWQVEQRLLDTVLADLPIALADVNYLDFACGTGRVLAHLETAVGHARGIDVSPAMLSIARQRLKSAELLCTDITNGDSPVEDRYDLITAFRFILNAEPELRQLALRQLALRLRDDRSRAVFTIHSHLPSHKVTRQVGSLIRRAIGRDDGTRRFLSRKQVVDILGEADLVVTHKLGYDVFSGKLALLVGRAGLLRIEQPLAGGWFANALGGHQMYVVRRST
jgi:SAM-dependent methyltransferase